MPVTANDDNNNDADFLVRSGIDDISVNPDAVVHVRKMVASVEKRIQLEAALGKVLNSSLRRIIHFLDGGGHPGITMTDTRKLLNLSSRLLKRPGMNTS